MDISKRFWANVKASGDKVAKSINKKSINYRLISETVVGKVYLQQVWISLKLLKA
jgi:hypothetical protein